MELREFIRQKAGEHGIAEVDFQEVSKFLQCNRWFGQAPQMEGGKFLLTEEAQDALAGPLEGFFSGGDDVLARLGKKFPETSGFLARFAEETETQEETCRQLADFLLFRLEKDIFLMDDNEAAALVGGACEELTKTAGDALTFFLAWLRDMGKTKYRGDYRMGKRCSSRTEAYSFDEFLELNYYLLNPDFIEAEQMYTKAADSKPYADTWLYLSLHMVCALRQTDLENLGHPHLTGTPEETLENIRNGTFPDNDARMALLGVIQRLEVLYVPPNKTKAVGNMPNIRLVIPESCETHFGRLFAACEAHHRLSGLGKDTPLVHKNCTYAYIRRVMGDRIGELFRYQDFSARSANKSYMQAGYMMADDVLGTEDGEPFVKGYMIAALARSHKGSVDEFSRTTAIYLKDAKTSGLTPEFVARELFERGVLSSIPSMMLSMATRGAYDRLSFSQQTKMIQALGMTPMEVERSVSAYSEGRRHAVEAVKALAGAGGSEEGRKAVLSAAHLIGKGEAYAKQSGYLCLMTALGKECPNSYICGVCPYEISTKSVFYLLIGEYNRLAGIYGGTLDENEKQKCAYILRNCIIPQFDEILASVRELYGEEAYRQYENLLKENVTQL